MTVTDAVVPLPATLSECGCRFAPTRHATTCQVAIAFDSVPLKERPEYVETNGRSNRFASISWDFPLRIEVRMNVEVELDPQAIILARADEYAAFEPEGGFEEWEKPILFLGSLIEEQLDCGGVSFGSRRLSHDRIDFDETTEYPRWKPEDTAQLDAALALLPDPNQGAFDV